MPRELELVRVTVRSHFLVREDGEVVTEAASENTVYAKEAAPLKPFTVLAAAAIEEQLGPAPKANRAARRRATKARKPSSA